jgi:hypothetical protein
MINHIVERVQAARSCVMNPGCLIDKFLDHLEKLSSLVLAAQVNKAVSIAHPHTASAAQPTSL